MSDETPSWARALGRLPSGLFIVTAGVGDQATGFLASWVQQVGFEPPSVTAAVKSGRFVGDLIREHDAFCVSILDDSSKSLLGHFARGFEPGQPAFEGVAVGVSEAGVPFLKDAHAHLECRLEGSVDWSDHTLFCGSVVGGAISGRDEDPMVHIRKTGLSY